MEINKRRNVMLLFLVLFLLSVAILLSAKWQNINITRPLERPNLTYESINDYYLSRLLDLSNSTDESILEELKGTYTTLNPLKIGVKEKYMYFFEIENTVFGVNSLLVKYLENFLEVPLSVEILDENSLEQYDIILAPEISKDIVNKYDFKTTDYFNKNFYLYSKEVPTADISTYINATIYIPNKYKSYLTEKQKNNFELYKIEVVFCDNDDVFSSSEEEKIYYIDTDTYGLLNNQYYYTPISKNFIGTYEKMYFNRTVNEYFSSEISKILLKSEFREIIQEYYYSLLQVELESKKFFTEEEVAFIENTKNQPLVFENTFGQASIDYYDESEKKWRGPLIDLWEEISKVSSINYTFTVRRDIEFQEILESVNSNPATIDGSFTVLDDGTTHDNFSLINASYETPLVFIGKVVDEKSYTLDNLFDKKIGIIDSNTFENFSISNFSGLNLVLYKDLESAYKALDKQELNLLALSYENFRNLFYEQSVYDIEIKKVTPVVLNYSSILSNNKAYSNTLYSIVSKTLLTIDETEVFSRNLKNNPTNIKNTVTFNKHMKNVERANIVLFILVFLLLILYINKQLVLKRTSRNLFIVENLAYEDSLTSLKNNIAFTNDLEENQIKGTVFVININDFRFIDINYSHKFGNLVLKSLAYTLLAFSIENSLKIYRVGNDTFTLVSGKPLSDEEALKTAKEIIKLTSPPLCILEKEINITIRIGIASCTTQNNAEDTYYRAESASINAKKLLKETSNPILISK